MKSIPFQLLLIAFTGTSVILYLNARSGKEASSGLLESREQSQESFGVTESPAQLMERFEKQNEEIRRRIGETRPDDKKSFWQSLKHKVGLTWTSDKSKTPEVSVDSSTKEEILEKGRRAAESMETVGDKIRDKARRTWDSVEEKLAKKYENSKERVKEGLEHTWEGAKEITKEGLERTWEEVKSVPGRTVHYVGEKIHDVKENIDEKIEFIKDTAKEDLVNLKEGAKETVKEGIHKVSEHLPLLDERTKRPPEEYSTHHKKKGYEPEDFRDDLSAI
jgi:hypothetical protein